MIIGTVIEAAVSKLCPPLKTWKTASFASVVVIERNAKRESSHEDPVANASHKRLEIRGTGRKTRGRIARETRSTERGVISSKLGCNLAFDTQNIRRGRGEKRC